MSCLEPKWANRPLLLMPTASARRLIDSPSIPSTVARRAASRRIASRLRAPSLRCLRVRLPSRVSAGDSLISLDKLARTFVYSQLRTNDRANYEEVRDGSVRDSKAERV